jgi:hypothetical protein
MSVVIPFPTRSFRAAVETCADGEVFVDDEAGLADFLAESTTVAVWRRRVPALVEVGAKLAATSFASEFAFRRSEPWTASLHADLVANGALSEIERSLLVADVARLAELLDDLVEAPEIGLRLRALSHEMCPRFHVDRVPLRLLCTYAGPGTEWLAETDVDRALLRAQVTKGACDPAMRGGGLRCGASHPDTSGSSRARHGPSARDAARCTGRRRAAGAVGVCSSRSSRSEQASRTRRSASQCMCAQVRALCAVSSCIACARG